MAHMLRVVTFLYFITFTTFYVQYNDFSQVVSGNIVIACDDECDGDGDNDHKAQSTRGPCCDNRGGGSGAFDKILLVAIDKILGPAGEKYCRLPVKGFPFTQVRSRWCTAVNCTPHT